MLLLVENYCKKNTQVASSNCLSGGWSRDVLIKNNLEGVVANVSLAAGVLCLCENMRSAKADTLFESMQVAVDTCRC